MMDFTVRRAERDDLEEASVVLGEAFERYAWTDWTVDSDDHVRRLVALQRLALEHDAMPFGEVWVAEVDGVVHCVAAWTDSRLTGSTVMDPTVEEQTARLEGNRHWASVEAQRQTPNWRPHSEHFLLASVGTRPAQRGLGLASALLTPVLAMLDRLVVPSFLETSSIANVGFYRRLHFDVVDHFRVTPDGPDVWAMQRRPRQ